MSAAPKCQGILGQLFGHKYIKAEMFSGYTFRSDYCWRCGMPQGGWRSAEARS